MPRRCTAVTAGLVFHVMNRAARRAPLFAVSVDYDAFERVLWEAENRVPMRLLAYVVMPNHWHLVVWPLADGALPRYMKWLTRTHAQRWHRAHGSTGTGALYQGRYKAVPVQTDRHFLVACRYVERNPCRSGLVDRPSDWRWSSAWLGAAPNRPTLAEWPVSRPADWETWLNAPEHPTAIRSLRRCTKLEVPYGAVDWTHQVALRLGLDGRLRGRGRPPRRA
jgi:putative transposase